MTDTAQVVETAKTVAAEVPAAADKTWAKIVAFLRKWGAAPWSWAHNLVERNPKTATIVIIVLALFAIR